MFTRSSFGRYRSMKYLRYTAVLLLIHGGIEILGGLMAFLPAGQIGYHIFAMPFLRDNLAVVGVIGIIFGILRIIAATRLRYNRLWVWYLTMIMCIVTLILMIFMIPSGIGDGILAGLTTIFLLIGRYGKLAIISD